MRHPIREMLAALLLVVLTAGCGGTSIPSVLSTPAGRSEAPGASTKGPTVPGVPGLAKAAVERTIADPADAALAAEAINDFGLELLRNAAAGENAVLSPASIVLALAMARAGAQGDTAVEMDEVLRGAAADANSGWLNALDAALAMRSGTFKDRFNKDADVLLRIANESFGQQGFPLESAYLEALASRFGAGVRLVDFIEHAEDARHQINAWVKDQTEDRIPELLPPGTVDSLTRLVLVNAIYLKAAWHVPFLLEGTKPAAFRGLDGAKVDVPTMHGSSGFRYAEGDGWQAVELPYVGRQLAMLVILPDDLRAFEARLDGHGLSQITAALEDRLVTLALPRFGIESKVTMNQVLADMGMPLAFDPDKADFDGISSADDDLYISAVIHQANIDVDEEGTEAAAATGVVVGTTSAGPEPVTMTVDRPFLFALRDLETGAILFLGRVVEPMERN